MFNSNGLAPFTVFLWLWFHGVAFAGGLLDGRVFTGMIGPAENPDLADSLHFNEGYFWSDICTRCGFLPGPYSSERAEDGILFRGILNGESRGRFEYEGRVRHDGTIGVSICWERKRWYWTSSREIAFRGAYAVEMVPLTLNEIRSMDDLTLTTTPLCARF